MDDRMPDKLGAKAKKLWTDVAKGPYVLRPDELRLLENACRTLDVIRALERILKDDGLMAEGYSGQPVVHPAVGELRQQRKAYADFVKQLALPDSDGKTTGQRLASGKASTAAKARWAI